MKLKSLAVGMILPLIGTIALSTAPAASAAPVNSQTVTPVKHNPFGHLDSVTSPAVGMARLRGWAIDPDHKLTPLQIAVYHDGIKTGLFKSSTYRPDVARVFHSGTHQGFQINVHLTKGKHSVCAYAINVGLGRNDLVGCKTITIK